MNSKKYLGLFVALVIFLFAPTLQVFATTVKSEDSTLQLLFPEKYTVISKSGVLNQNGLSNQMIEQIITMREESSLDFIAITQDLSEEINIELFKNTDSMDYNLLSDDELSNIGKQIFEDIDKSLKETEGSENVKIQTPTIYHHKQTIFFLIESTTGDVHTSQYLTVYKNKNYRVLLANYKGEVNTREAENFLENFKFLDNPIINTTLKLKSDFAEIADVGKDVIAVALVVVPYFYIKKKMKAKKSE